MISLFDGEKGGSESLPFFVIYIEIDKSSSLFEYILGFLSSPLYKG